MDIEQLRRDQQREQLDAEAWDLFGWSTREPDPAFSLDGIAGLEEFGQAGEGEIRPATDAEILDHVRDDIEDVTPED